MDSNENMCGQGNFQRKTVTGRTGQLLRLLHGATCFEAMLNRRMPNGMYGGVRGERKSPLLDCRNIENLKLLTLLGIGYIIYFVIQSIWGKL